MAGGILLQNAATSGNGTVFDFRGRGGPYTLSLVSTGTITAGEVQFERALTPDYTGTWEPIGAAFAAAPTGQVQTATFDGPLHCVRARITVAVAGGGSVSARIQPPPRQY